MKREPSEADILLWQQLKPLQDRYECLPEVYFCKGRRWRFDFAILGPGIGVAIEIEGGAFTQGRHTRGAGFIKDMEKYNQAVLLGWRVLRFTPQQVLRGEAIAFVRKVLESS